jgi:ATP-binding cassette subfamily B protein
VYGNPEYVFLDEANTLYANNERVIVENLSDFYCGRSSSPTT